MMSGWTKNWGIGAGVGVYCLVYFPMRNACFGRQPVAVTAEEAPDLDQETRETLS